MTRTSLAFTILAVGGLACATPRAAGAVGCMSGAAVGGVAGHYAGHHAVLGAIAGCAVGHHQHVLQRRRAEQDAIAQRNAAEAARQGVPSQPGYAPPPSPQ